MSYSMLQAVLLHAPRYLTPSRARPSAPTGGVSHLRHPQHLTPKIHDFRFIVPKRRYGTITQYLLYRSHVPAMQTAPTYRYFRPQNLPKLQIWHTPTSTTTRERTFCYKLSTPCSKKSYSRLQDVLLHAPRYLTPSRARPSAARSLYSRISRRGLLA